MDESVDLLYALLNLPEDTDISEASDLLYDRYEIDFDQFEKLVKDLLKFTPIVRTAFTNTKVHAFINFKEDPNIILMREEVADAES